jgi:two-component system heavy metal sensor histidine kinase CusS
MTLLHSVRARLTFWYAAMLLAGLMAFSGWMWLAIRQYLAASADDRIVRRMQGLNSAIEEESDESINALREELREFGIEIPEGELTAVRGRGGRDLLRPAGIPDATLWSAPEDHIGDLSFNSTRFRAIRRHVSIKGESYDLAAATSTAEADAFLQQFGWLLIGAAPMMAIIASFSGYWMSRRALSPVDALTTAARRISLDNLGQRLPVSRTGDELERLGDTWNEMLERLDNAVQRMRQFTADASHELRTPISIIRTASELALRRERTPDEYRKALESIYQESQWMTHLAEDLLLLARADAGSLTLKSERLDIDALVRDVALETAPMAEVRGIHVRTRLEAGEARVQGDEHVLHRILTILLDNAVQHTPAEGTIEIETSATDGRLGIDVRNSGEGIGSEDLPHIFERFYRGDPARTRQTGAGLGLAIARSLVDALGAEIEVESAAGQGAVFRLRLSQ